MVHVVGFIVYGSWFMVHGLLFMAYETSRSRSGGSSGRCSRSSSSKSTTPLLPPLTPLPFLPVSLSHTGLSPYHPLSLSYTGLSPSHPLSLSFSLPLSLSPSLPPSLSPSHTLAAPPAFRYLSVFPDSGKRAPLSGVLDKWGRRFPSSQILDSTDAWDFILHGRLALLVDLKRRSHALSTPLSPQELTQISGLFLDLHAVHLRLS